MDEPIPALTLHQAKAIVQAMDEAKLLELPLPATDSEMIEKAKTIVQQAHNYASGGATIPVVDKVLEIANPANDTPPFDIPSGSSYHADVPPTYADLVPQSTPDMVEDNPRKNNSSEDTVAVDTRATLLESDGEKESSPYDPIPALPRDYSKVGDLELRSLYAVRVALLSKHIHDLAIEESDYEDAQTLRKRAYTQAQLGIDADKVTERRQAAEVTKEVMEWDDKVAKHHRQVKMLRAYVQILESETKHLSREYTMRETERGTPNK